MDLSSVSHSMLKVRFRGLIRRCIRFCGGISNRDVEYDFVYRQVVGEKISILDIGGSESLLPLRFAQRGHRVTVYDYREYPEKHPGLVSIRGDFLDNQLPEHSFDYILFISTIEHIGFGSYGAPTYEDGDLKAMEEAIKLLKPDGRLLFTFPFASKEHHVPGYERWYDWNRVQRLFEGLYILAEEYYVPGNRLFGRIVKWLPASLDQIMNCEDVLEKYGSQCNACYVVSPKARHNS